MAADFRVWCRHCGEVLTIRGDRDAFQQGFDHAWSNHPHTIERDVWGPKARGPKEVK